MVRRRAGLLGMVIAGLVALGSLILFGLASSGPASGRIAPALPAERLAGGPVSLQSMLAADGHRPVAVVFWASWCGPCEREASAIARFAASPGGAGRVVAVDWSDGLSGARAFVHRYGWTFPVLRDAEGAVGSAYRLTALPTTFIVDGSGHIRAVLRGPQQASTLEPALVKAEVR